MISTAVGMHTSSRTTVMLPSWSQRQRRALWRASLTRLSSGRAWNATRLSLTSSSKKTPCISVTPSLTRSCCAASSVSAFLPFLCFCSFLLRVLASTVVKAVVLLSAHCCTGIHAAYMNPPHAPPLLSPALACILGLTALEHNGRHLACTEV